MLIVRERRQLVVESLLHLNVVHFEGLTHASQYCSAMMVKIKAFLAFSAFLPSRKKFKGKHGPHSPAAMNKV